VSSGPSSAKMGDQGLSASVAARAWMIRILVVCEAPIDQQTASELTDRILRREIDPLGGHDDLSSFRVYQGLSGDLLLWTEVAKAGARRPPRPAALRPPVDL